MTPKRCFARDLPSRSEHQPEPDRSPSWRRFDRQPSVDELQDAFLAKAGV
jgi:hypothetical protein